MNKLFSLIFPSGLTYMQTANLLCRYQSPGLCILLCRDKVGEWYAEVSEVSI